VMAWNWGGNGYRSRRNYRQRYRPRRYGRGRYGGGRSTYYKPRGFATYAYPNRKKRSSQKYGRFKHTDFTSVLRKTPFLLGQINPFDTLVKGVKVPDANTMNSDTATICESFPLSITTGGNVKAWVCNVWPRGCLVTSTEGVSTWSWTASYGGSSDYSRISDISASYAAIRCCAHGVRLSCTLAPTAATGFVHMAVYAPSTYGEATWPFPTSIGAMSDLPWYRKVTLASLTQNPITIVNKFLDQTAFRYEEPDQGSAGFANSNRGEFHIPHSWGSIIIAVEGTPAGALFSAEQIVHYEALPLQGTMNASSPAAPSDPAQMQAAGHASGTVDTTHFGSEETSILRDVASAVQDGLSQGMSTARSGFLDSIREHAAGMAITAGTAFSGAMLNNQGGGIPGINDMGRLMQ